MAPRPTKVLVVDDEPAIRRFLRTSLAAQDYEVVEAANGAEALAMLVREKPDVIVLDLGLPDLDGTEVIRRVREQSAIPIVVLSVRDDERGKVGALDLGADDYVVKPFGMDELLARLRTAMRHGLQSQGASPVFQLDALKVDLVLRHVLVGDVEVKLSPKEYDVLAELVKHAGKVLTHKHLLRAVWGQAYAEDVQYLRVFIRQLRRKLEADPARPAWILTESGVGYRLRAPA
jgi:two-component system KDP operon response regulator KdpE